MTKPVKTPREILKHLQVISSGKSLADWRIDSALAQLEECYGKQIKELKQRLNAIEGVYEGLKASRELATPLEPIDEKALTFFLDNIDHHIKNSNPVLAHHIATKFGVSNKLEPLDLDILWQKLNDGGFDHVQATEVIAIIKKQFGSPTKKDV